MRYLWLTLTAGLFAALSVLTWGNYPHVHALFALLAVALIICGALAWWTDAPIEERRAWLRDEWDGIWARL